MKFTGNYDSALPPGISPPAYLGGPDAADREQARRFGVQGDRLAFEQWARMAYKGRFFKIFDTEYQEGAAHDEVN